jgi:3-keto-5-aminohexanoate cleavage enzyme
MIQGTFGTRVKGVEKLIITAAITGAEVTKEQNPNLPVTPAEQARASKECVEQGAAIIHLHVRDKNGKPSQEVDDFRTSIETIRSACNPQPIIQISTGGAIGEPMEKRIRPLGELKPEMASLNVGSMNFMDDVFINSPRDVKKLASTMKELRVVPEVEVYDTAMIEVAQHLATNLFLGTPIHYQMVLGVLGGLSGEPRNLIHMVEMIDYKDTWAVAGVGRYELPLAVMAIVMGGHVRVGLEDNIYYSKGVLAKSNAQLVARVVRISREIGRDVAGPDEARKILNLTEFHR